MPRTLTLGAPSGLSLTLTGLSAGTPLYPSSSTYPGATTYPNGGLGLSAPTVATPTLGTP